MTGALGLVLAAGASTRMGQPKALLETPGGEPLAVYQARLLRAAGCAETLIVLGARAEHIAPRLAPEPWVHHPEWRRGRFSSLQAGLRARPGFDGYLILPVDTVGVRVETLAALLARAIAQPARAWRPRVHGRPGRVLWMSGELASRLAAEPSSDLALDEHLADVTSFMESDDDALLNNINTPDAWAAVFGKRC